MQKYKYITLLFVVLFLVGCAKDDFITIGDSRGEKAVYGFGVGGGTTRTFINDDGVTISWDKDDKVALWAKAKGSDSYTLSNKTFDTWFVSADKSQAFFTAELDSQMDVGEYQYYVTYPKPASASGTTATFNLPSTQDGKMGSGADIMVAQGTGPALAKLYIPAPEEGETSEEEGEKTEGDPNYVLDQNRLSLNMHHLIHALRFYVPQGKWGFPQGETVERIVLTMPQNIAGVVKTDVANTNGGLTLDSNGSKTIALSLTEDLVASTSGDMNYAVAAILPPNTTYGANDKLLVTVYSQKRFVTQEISLNGRGPQATNENMRMAAGRVTPVGLDCSVTSNPKITFRIKSNNLGEEPYRITLESANTNAKWKSGEDHVYEYYTGSENKTIPTGGGFEFDSDFESISTIWDEQVKVTYESKSAIVTQTIELPAMELKAEYIIEGDVPYLFAENFDARGENDEAKKAWENTTCWNYTYGSSGESAWFPEYLKGWSGNQWRTDGDNIGVYSYTGNYTNASIFSSYTNFHYGRIDSPILPLKKDVKLNLKIDFEVVSMTTAADNGSPSLIYGYSNNNEPISGGYIAASTSEKNVLNKRNLPTKQVGQEITSSGNISPDPFEVSDSENLRITWFVNIKHKGSGSITNRKFYVYIDNVTVKIVP